MKIWSDAEYQQVDIKPQQQHQTHTYIHTHNYVYTRQQSKCILDTCKVKYISSYTNRERRSVGEKEEKERVNTKINKYSWW